MRHARLLFALALLVISACAGPSAATAGAFDDGLRPPAQYFPLTVGNRWVYRTRFGKTVEENVVTIDRQEGAVFRDNRGSVLGADAEGVRDERRYLLKAPLTPGASWKSTVEVGRIEEYTVLAVDEAVTVPAGTFHGCVLVRGKSVVDAGTELEIEWAYAPRVGLVKMETTAVIGKKERVPQTVIELTSYKVP